MEAGCHGSRVFHGTEGSRVLWKQGVMEAVCHGNRVSWKQSVMETECHGNRVSCNQGVIKVGCVTKAGCHGSRVMKFQFKTS